MHAVTAHVVILVAMLKQFFHSSQLVCFSHHHCLPVLIITALWLHTYMTSLIGASLYHII